MTLELNSQKLSLQKLDFGNNNSRSWPSLPISFKKRKVNSTPKNNNKKTLFQLLKSTKPSQVGQIRIKNKE